MRLMGDLALEPVCCHNLAGLAEAVRLTEAVASPGLAFLLDPVNLVPDGGLAEPAAPALAFIEALGKRMVAVHAKEFVISGGLATESAEKVTPHRIAPCYH